ncbi:riboflavin synthase [Sulfurospirillum sp. 1307]|jgi:riboflavin synthase
MFTGLIREIASVVSYKDSILSLKAKHKAKLGDSIAVNGVCLTVIAIKDDIFSVELSGETRSIMAHENLKDKVHIEPAMRLSDRLEGHIVQGHVDCVGQITQISKNDNAVDMRVKIPSEFKKFIIPKGSIAIDGVSLTINEVGENDFRLTIISHTLKETLFSEYNQGRRVNIETDMFARYIYHMFKTDEKLTWDKVDNIMALY